MHNLVLIAGWISDTLLLGAGATDVLQQLMARVYNILQVALGIGFVIFIHELGHFLAAKFFGVKCEKFYLGFDVPIKIGPIALPSRLARFQWGETEYGIGIIPLGGYVKMLGQDDDPRNAQAEAERIRVQSKDGHGVGTGTAALDPRSYPAKPVYARMVIISAGVIMNLISAVFLAAAAYGLGAPYLPTIVGNVSAGDPAWQNAIRPGDHIVQVGKMKKPSEHLSWEDLMNHTLTFGFASGDEPFPMTVERDGQLKAIEGLHGTKDHDPKHRQMMIGVTPERTTQINREFVYETDVVSVVKGEGRDDSDSNATHLMPGDKIVAAEGNPISVDPRLEETALRYLQPYFLRNMDQPISLEVERTAGDQTKKVTVSVPPTPMRTLGFHLMPGAVTATQKNGVAEKAGVKVGDKLIAIDGNPIDDALTLPLYVARKHGQSVALTLETADAEPRRYEVSWTVPDDSFLGSSNNEAPIGFELLGAGLTYSVSNRVSGTDQIEGAPASELKAGDQITSVIVQPATDESKLALQRVFRKPFFEAMRIDQKNNAVLLHELLQNLPLDLPMHVYFDRNGKVQETTLRVQNSPTWNWHDRGLNFVGATKERKATSFSEAMMLGASETWKQMTRVGHFLWFLITNTINLFDLGGPVAIFSFASTAASKGVTTLLIFLTMLSANLAILNFLPIPALDGGHMVFLIAEAFRRKPVDEKLQVKLTVAGVVSLLALMLFVIANDIYRFFLS